MNNLTQYSDVPKYIKRKITQGPQWPDSSVFNKNIVFKLENYGNLKMLFLKITLTTDAQMNYPIPSSPYIIENVQLESNGLPIARINTNYTLFRLDQLETDIYNNMVYGMSFSGPLVGSQTVSLPLFFWTLDNNEIDMSKYTNLTLRVQTKSSTEKMGIVRPPAALVGSITNIDIKLEQVYRQYPDNNMSMTLKNSYNMYQLAPQLTPTIPTTGTSIYKINLNVPFNVVNLVFQLRKTDNAAIKGLISGVDLQYTDGTIEKYDNLSNYNLNTTTGANIGNSFVVNFGSRYDSSLKGPYMKFNGNMNPVVATLYISPPDVATIYDVFICYEYISDIIDSKGHMVEDIKQSFYFN